MTGPASFLRARLDLVAVLGLAAVLRLAVFLAAFRSPARFWSQDDREYLGLATHLHAGYLTGSGHWFEIGLRRPPLYPLFIRLVYDVFGRHYAPLVAVQLVISVATVGLVFWLAQMLLPRRFALAAALLLAIDPASIVFANQMLTETVFAFLLTLAIALIVVGERRGAPVPVLAAGLVLGIATLTRPVAEYLPLVLLAALVLPSARRRSVSFALSAALVAGFALPVGGWVIRNALETGVPIVSTIDGHNMLDYRAVGALDESGELPWIARRHVAERLSGRVRPGQNPAEISRAQMRLGLTILAEHPVGTVKSWAKGEARLLGGPAKTETAILLTGRQRVGGALHALVALDQLVTLLLVLGGAAGMLALALGRVHVRVLWLLSATVAYLVVISGGPEAYSRFRVPVAPLLAVLAAAAARAWADRDRRSPLRTGARARAPRSP